MKAGMRLISLFAMVLFIFSPMFGQRRVTPVATPAGVNQNKENSRANLVESKDSEGNIILIDTVAGAVVNDTTILPPPPKMVYPLWQSLTIGVNLWDAAMRLFSQHYGIGSVRAQLNMHNRYIPELEFGLSQAAIHASDGNYIFRSGVSPYLKVGFAYNLFYNSNPDYSLSVGLRYGITRFSSRVTDAVIDEGYWDSPSVISLPRQTVTAGYFELGIGLRVKVAGPVSLGWNASYHSMLHQSRHTYGSPMVVPGYGKRGPSFSAAFYIMYTLNLHKHNHNDDTERTSRKTGGTVQ